MVAFQKQKGLKQVFQFLVFLPLFQDQAGWGPLRGPGCCPLLVVVGVVASLPAASPGGAPARGGVGGRGLCPRPGQREGTPEQKRMTLKTTNLSF